MVLPASDQKSQEGATDTRLKVETAAFGRGRRSPADASFHFNATIHSFRTNDAGQRTAIRFERKPGHMHTVDLSKLPDNWVKAAMTWQVGQTTDLVKPTPTSHFVLPKALLDQEINPFTVGSSWTVTIGECVQQCAVIKLTPRIDGVIPIGEISWDWIADVRDVLKAGQQVTVEVLGVDMDEYSIGLSIKKRLPHPWDAASSKYRVCLLYTSPSPRD